MAALLSLGLVLLIYVPPPFFIYSRSGVLVSYKVGVLVALHDRVLLGLQRNPSRSPTTSFLAYTRRSISETIVSVVTEVLGKVEVQSLELKNQSSLSRRGGSCLVVQVNFLPCRGNSTTPGALIASLNRSISEMSPPGLFLFFEDLMRLKSPMSNNGKSSGI